MAKIEPGTRVEVLVGGRPFMTEVDEDGVQRFVGNPVVAKVVDGLIDVFNLYLGNSGGVPVEYYGLNELGRDYAFGEYTQDDMLTFYTDMQYSVAGLADLSYFRGLTIENPLW